METETKIERPAVEIVAPDGTVVYRVLIERDRYLAARYKGRVYPALGGIRGPMWMSTAWGSTKA